jgi:hypothetical protein
MQNELDPQELEGKIAFLEKNLKTLAKEFQSTNLGNYNAMSRQKSIKRKNLLNEGRFFPHKS